jgi:hypothetical protein
LHDAVMVEQQGTPATVLITEPFQPIVASHAMKLGAPGYHFLTVPHPVWGKDDEELRALARPIVDRAIAQLLRPGG